MAERYPIAPRILAAAGAVAVAYLFGIDIPLGLLARDLPWSAYVLVGCTVPLVVFLGMLAAAPAALQAMLRRISRVDLRDGGHVAAVVVMAATLFAVIGYGSVFDGVFAYETSYPHGPAPLEAGAYAAPALNASESNGTIVLNWSVIAGAERYHIYRGADAGGERRIATAAAAPYRDEAALPGVTWHYRVSAEGPAGEGAASASQEATVPESANGLFAGLVLNVIVLVLPVILYVAFVHGGGPAGAARAIGLGLDGAGRKALIGFAAAFGFIVLLEVVVALAGRANLTAGDNERALGIAQSVAAIGGSAWVGAIAVAALSAFSEEVFFRGFLQPRLGILGSAVVFALAHVNYVNVLEIVVVFALAIVLGLLLRFTRSLWAPIATHFLFNLLMLLAAIYAVGPGKA